MTFGKKLSRFAGRTFARLFLCLLCLSVLYPLFWNLINSFRTSAEFFNNPWGMPKELFQDGKISTIFSNYVRVWNITGLSIPFMNSLIISLSSLVGGIVLNSMSSYGCTRLGLRAGDMLSKFYLFMMFVPGGIALTAGFLHLRSLGLLDTRMALILGNISGSAIGTGYILRNFFRTLPHELEEAAYIDGSGIQRTFWTIMLPLAKPGIATVSIFNFLNYWSEYTSASVLITSDSKRPLSVALYTLQSSTQRMADWTGLFAGMIIVLIPIMLLYIMFQKYIVSGMTAGAIKG